MTLPLMDGAVLSMLATIGVLGLRGLALADLGNGIAEPEGQMADVGADPGGGVGGRGEGVGRALVADSEYLLNRPAVAIVSMNLVFERDEDRD